MTYKQDVGWQSAMARPKPRLKNPT
uniref:Uncharacterized protein n=1 Tax=Anguilla anguilla TaxID=7936 RepID=A0A0E9UWL3_ANGAN